LSGLVSLRFVSVIYRAPRYYGTACCSRACRGPIDAWWYFEEGRTLRAHMPRTIAALISCDEHAHNCGARIR
jgi:hypothetical protein